jgi:hypothetical protein
VLDGDDGEITSSRNLGFDFRLGRCCRTRPARDRCKAWVKTGHLLHVDGVNKP